MVASYSGAERRKFRRTPVRFIVFYKVSSPLEIKIRFGDKEIIAFAVDISEGGMAIATDYDIPAVSVVTVKFIMLNDNAIAAQDRSRSITVQGEICYNLVIRERRDYRIGIRFLSLSADDRRFICNFVSADT